MPRVAGVMARFEVLVIAPNFAEMEAVVQVATPFVETTRVVEEAFAGMVTEFGTGALLFPEPSNTEIPDAGAIPERVTFPIV